MPELSLFSQISLYVLLTLIGILALSLWYWQIIELVFYLSLRNACGASLHYLDDC